MAGKQITFDILARDKASQTFDKVGKHSDGLGKKLGGLGKAAALGVAGAAAGSVYALGRAMTQGVKDAASYQDLQNRTKSVLKSTGNAANTSVKQIQEHAGALESLSGVDEELIINSQNVLATFTQVQNKVGKGNDIFDRATKTALDMSTALGTDLQGSTIQVGKALNDPVKGITALSRVGVSFTDQQKKQIKTLVKSGDTLGAQKVILGELSKEFGGAAKAAGEGFNGSIARVKDMLGDTFRDIGMKMLPILTQLADWFAKVGPKAIASIIGHVKGFIGVIKGLISGFKSGGGAAGTFRDLIGGIASFFQTHLIPAVKGFVGKLLPALKGLFKSVSSTMKDHQGVIRFVGGALKVLGLVVTQIILPVLGDLVQLLLKVLGPAFRAIVSIIDHIVIPAIKLILSVFLNIVGGIIKGAAQAFGWVPGLGPKLKNAAAKFDDFKRQVNAALNGTKSHKRITVTTPGADAAIKKLATLRWQTDHIDPTVTVRAYVRANKVPGFASGVRNFRGGAAIVGERGPELVTLPRGSNVHTASDTAAMMGGGGNVTVQFVLDGKVIQQSLLRLKRTNGGRTLGVA